MLVHGFFFFFIADPLWLLFFPFNLQAPEWFRHEQHNILAESGFGLGCGCSSGFCYLQSCCQTEITDKLERLSPPQPDAPSIKTKPLWPDAEPPQLELDKVHVILLFFFNTLKASRTLSISLPFPSSDLFSTLKSVDHITPAASWWSYYSPCCRAQLFPPYIVRPG